MNKVEWGQMRMIEKNNDFDLAEGIEKLREMEKHIVKVLRRVNIRPYAFKVGQKREAKLRAKNKDFRLFDSKFYFASLSYL